MKKMNHNVQALFKKPAIGMLAAVTAFTSMVPLSAGMPANAYTTDDLASRIQEIAKKQEDIEEDHTQLLSEYKSGKQSKLPEAVKFKALFVKCSDVTVNEKRTVDGKETIVPKRYVIGHDSDVNTVIDHGISRFEETVEETTAHALDIVPTTIWVDDPLTVPDGGFGYNELRDTIANPIPVEQYDSVFFFSAKEGVYSVTGRGVRNEYGESYIQTVCVADEMQHIKDGLDINEERKMLWTCGNMTHEWIHQLDFPAKYYVDDEHFPLCHDYLVEGGTFEDLEQTTENGDLYLTNPQNGYKWKYVPGKYPDHLGDYYEAFLAGEIIDTKDGNKKKGMSPRIWKYIRDTRDLIFESGNLGVYTLQNVKTGNFLCAADEKDRFGANVLKTVKAEDMDAVSLKWNMSYETSLNHPATVQISPVNAPTQLIRSEKGDTVDTVALYERAWGTDELDNKNFSFKIVRTNDGNYQIKSTLNAFADYNLCENADGSLDLKQDNASGTWKLKRIDAESDMPGDVNCDYVVDIADVVLLARFCAEDPDVMVMRQGKLNADVNGNNQPDSDDTIMILRHIARILDLFG